MATTGTFSFSPTIADFIDEAFSLCQIDPESIAEDHIESALRSLNLLFVEWENDKVKGWKNEEFVLTTTASTGTFTLNARVILVLSAMYKKAGQDTETPIHPIGRLEYEQLNDKTTTADTANRYYIDRLRDAPQMIVWPLPLSSGDTITIQAFVQTEDAGEMSNNADAPRRWYDALANGLARRLARKYVKDKALRDEINAEALIAVNKASTADRDIAPTRLSVRLDGRRY